MALKLITLLATLALYLPLHGQFHVELGVNYLNAPSTKLGGGVYVEPRHSLGKHYDLGLHLGLNGTLSEEQSKSTRISGGTLPVITGNIYRRFQSANAKEVTYVGFGTGLYLSSGINFRKGIKSGASLHFGMFLNRSNIGFTYNFVPDNSFFQVKYGVRIFGGKSD